MKTEILSTRIDQETKAKFNHVCEAIGLSPSQAMKLFIQGVINYGGIPFELKVRQPNLETIEAMNELQDGKGSKANNVESMLNDLTGGKASNA